jgi:hypothetical protein
LIAYCASCAEDPLEILLRYGSTRTEPAPRQRSEPLLEPLAANGVWSLLHRTLV